MLHRNTKPVEFTCIRADVTPQQRQQLHMCRWNAAPPIPHPHLPPGSPTISHLPPRLTSAPRLTRSCSASPTSLHTSAPRLTRSCSASCLRLTVSKAAAAKQLLTQIWICVLMLLRPTHPASGLPCHAMLCCATDVDYNIAPAPCIAHTRTVCTTKPATHAPTTPCINDSHRVGQQQSSHATPGLLAATVAEAPSV